MVAFGEVVACFLAISQQVLGLVNKNVFLPLMAHQCSIVAKPVLEISTCKAINRQRKRVKNGFIQSANE